MNIFDYVKNDEEVISIYNKIKQYEDREGGWAYHELNHVSNVADLVEQILSELKYEEDLIEEAKIAAILHDIGCLEGKENHSIRGYEYAKEYFKKNNLDLKYEEMVLEAIKIHSDGFNTDNIIALALILSDKLDIKYTRISEAGKSIEGNRQLQYMKDVLINITDNEFIVSFICDKKVNKKELEEYYFIKKAFNAIKAFSKKIKRKPVVLFNNKEWELFYTD